MLLVSVLPSVVSVTLADLRCIILLPSPVPGGFSSTASSVGPSSVERARSNHRPAVQNHASNWDLSRSKFMRCGTRSPAPLPVQTANKRH